MGATWFLVWRCSFHHPYPRPPAKWLADHARSRQSSANNAIRGANMDQKPANVAIPLREALTTWCDERLANKVRSLEAVFTAHELLKVGRHPRLSSEDELAKPSRDRWMAGQPDFEPLLAAYRALERAFVEKVVCGEIYLRGVLTRPELTIHPVDIPNAWVSDGSLDFVSGKFSISDRRYVAVIASRIAPEVSPPPGCAAQRDVRGEVQGPITAANVRALSDDEVLTLLEDHARRVVESANAKLIAPGKISLMPVILRKMRRRFETSELEGTLAAESEYLANWIHEKVPSHQAPGAKSIRNALRTHYRDLKA